MIRLSKWVEENRRYGWYGFFGVLICIVTVYVLLEVLGPELETEILDYQTCGPKTLEAQCYKMSHENCRSVWTTFEVDCRAEIKAKTDPKRLTSLVGTEIKKCVQKKMDKTFHSTRKIDGGLLCQSFFAGLDAPSLD